MPKSKSPDHLKLFAEIHSKIDKLNQTGLIINEDDIDGTVRSQPSKYYEAGELHAESVAMRDTVKNQIQTTRSELYIEIRETIESGGKKITEANLAAMVDTDKGMLDLSSILVQANLLVGKVSALKDAFSQRSFAIRDIVALTIHNFMATNTITKSGVGNDAANIEYDKNRKEIAKHRKGKKELKRK